MGIAILSWLLAIPLLGLATGLRSMTPMAVLCWYANLGYLPVDATWASWTTRLSVAIGLTVLAIGEIVADKFPWVPDRVSPGPLIWRLLLGGLAGSIAATSLNGAGIEGVLLGVVGAAVGAFGGFMVRRDLSEKFMCHDWQIAVGEDLLAVICSIYAMHVLTA
jgi:uncharacterized membrane protein